MDVNHSIHLSEIELREAIIQYAEERGETIPTQATVKLNYPSSYLSREANAASITQMVTIRWSGNNA